MTGDDLDPLAATAAETEGASATTAAEIAIGGTIERYRVTGVLGRGGMGIVYAAHDPELDRPIAIKVLRSELRHDRGRLLREGQAIARLTHPNVVAVYDVGTLGEDLFIAMELVRGTTLGAWFGNAPKPWRDVIARAIPAGRGLAAAHVAGLVHRDFKPDNVLLGTDGRVVVTDFGIARDERRRDEDKGTVVGTPAYMPLEQLRGDVADARSDQFSFCVAIWEGLAGRRPHAPDAKTIEDLVEAVAREQRTPLPREVPAWLVAVLERGMASDPAARFPAMPALLAALAPTRARRNLVLGGGALLAAGAVIAAVAMGGSTTPAIDCAAPSRAAHEVWEAARAAHRARFAAEPWRDEEARWFDAFASRWSSARTKACATNATEQAACLGRALDRFRVAVARTSTLWPELPALADSEHELAAPITLPDELTPGIAAILSPRGDRMALSRRSSTQIVSLAPPYTATPVADARAVFGWLDDDRLVVEHANGELSLRGNTGDIPLASRVRLAQENRRDAVSLDGRFRASLEPDAIRIVRISDGEVLATSPGIASTLAWERGGTRLIATRAHTLAILDAADGTLRSVDLRLRATETGFFGVASPGPGRVLLSGLAQGHEKVWELALARDGLASYPEVRAEADAALVVDDAVRDRALVSQFRTTMRMRRFAHGGTRLLPAVTTGLVLHGIDRASARLVTSPRPIGAEPGDAARTLTFDGELVTTAPLAVGATPALRDGVLLGAVRTGAAVAITALEGSDPPLVIPAPGEYAAVRCHAGRDHCVIITKLEGGGIAIVRLADRARLEISSAVMLVDVLRDGSVLVPRRDGKISRLTPDGAVTDLATIAPGCLVTSVRADPDERVVWASTVCGERYDLGRLEDGVYRVVISGNSYVSGLEVLGPDDIVYSALDVDASLVMYGL